MTTPMTQDEAKEAIATLGRVLIGDLSYEHRDGEGGISCPTCTQSLIHFDFEWTDSEKRELALARLSKVYTWTVAQLVGWLNLQKRSGISIEELLDRTSTGHGDHVGVSNFHGMYVGIEADGYTHT